MQNNPKFRSREKGEITTVQTLKNRVNDYFKTNNIKMNGNWYLYHKTIILLVLAVAHYFFLVLFPFTPMWVKAILCVSSGLVAALIGFNLMHDGGHGSYSKKQWVNELMGYSLNLVGGILFFWKEKHNVTHHTFTNIRNVDKDIEIPFMRIHEEDTRHWYHRYQHYYWVFLYGLSYISWITTQDFEKYFKYFRTMPAKEHFIFWFTKLGYLWVFILYPVWKFGSIALLGYLLFAYVCGLTISIVFQLAHVVPQVAMPVPNSENTIEQKWEIHQVRTTANFATHNKFLYWCLGGLNFQIEHHLFPRISHVHYPQIQKIVKDWCKEFKLPYTHFRSMGRAVQAHIIYLKLMGRKCAF